MLVVYQTEGHVTKPTSILPHSALVERLKAVDPERDAYHDVHNVFERSAADIKKLLGTEIGGLSILVLGCGYTYPDPILYTHAGASVKGLDVHGAFSRDGLWKTFNARKSGRNPALAFLESLFVLARARRYHKHLSSFSGAAVDHNTLDLRNYDGEHIPFEDNHFDAVISNAVLEHMFGMDKVVDEVCRVTKPGGISYHHWHNFYSLSGGHAPEPMRSLEPWGHVRGTYEIMPLNKLTPDETAEHFGRRFADVEIVSSDREHRKKGCDPDFSYEAEDLLTPELEEEMSDCSRELLLTRSYLLTARKMP